MSGSDAVNARGVPSDTDTYSTGGIARSAATSVSIPARWGIFAVSAWKGTSYAPVSGLRFAAAYVQPFVALTIVTFADGRNSTRGVQRRM